MQHQRKLMQLPVAKALGFDRPHSGQHVVAVVAGAAMPLLHDAKLLAERQAAGILDMPAIDHIGQRADALPCLVVEPDRTHHLAIDVCGLLAATQIVHRAVAQARSDTEGDAATGATAVEPEYQARLFWCATMI